MHPTPPQSLLPSFSHLLPLPLVWKQNAAHDWHVAVDEGWLADEHVDVISSDNTHCVEALLRRRSAMRGNESSENTAGMSILMITKNGEGRDRQSEAHIPHEHEH